MIGNRVALAAAFAAGVVALAVGCTNRRAAPPPDAGPPVVTVARPVVRAVTQFTDLTGVLKAVQYVELRPQVSGYITKVNFKDGSHVKAGEVLVEIDPTLYKADLQKAKADQENAEASLELAKADEARLTRLRKTSGAVSQEEYDAAVAKRKVADANVAGAKATVSRAEQNLAWTKVRSPIDGRVDRILVTEGNLVAGGTGNSTVLTDIVSMDPVYAYFDVDEQTVLSYRRMIVAGKVKSAEQGGVPCEIQLRGETGYPHKGTLDFVSNQLNPGTGSLQVRGTFPNPGPPWLLAPGLFVRGRVPSVKLPNAVLIPDQAVTTDQAQRIVFVVTKNDKGQDVPQARPVVLGPLADGLRVVESGVGPDDRVVWRGLQRIIPGTPVEANEEPFPAQPPPPDQRPGAGGGKAP